MMGLTLRHIAVAGLLAAMSACAGSDDRYPSLALRPFESGTAVAAAPAPPAAVPLPLSAPIRPEALAQIAAAAQADHAAFLERESAAARLARAAAGQGADSSARAAALVALADLDSRRGASAGRLAMLDSAAAESAAAARAPDPALLSLQADLAALLAREDAGIARLWDVIGS